MDIESGNATLIFYKLVYLRIKVRSETWPLSIRQMLPGKAVLSDVRLPIVYI